MCAAAMNTNIIVILFPLWNRTNLDYYISYYSSFFWTNLWDNAVKGGRGPSDWGLDTLLLILRRIVIF